MGVLPKILLRQNPEAEKTLPEAEVVKYETNISQKLKIRTL